MSDNYEKTSLQDYPHSPFSKRGFHFPQVYENSLDNNIFLIFRPLLQVGYYLLLIPFRFGKRSDGSYYIHTNLLQQVWGFQLFYNSLKPSFTDSKQFTDSLHCYIDSRFPHRSPRHASLF